MRRNSFLTQTEVARLYGVGITTVERWTRAGIIPSIKTPEGARRYVAADILRALEESRQERVVGGDETGRC